MSIIDLERKQIGAAGFVQTKEAGTPVGVQANSGTFYAVQFVTACTTTTFNVAGNSTALDAVTYPAGMVVYADITSIICETDDVYILYRN